MDRRYARGAQCRRERRSGDALIDERLHRHLRGGALRATQQVGLWIVILLMTGAAVQASRNCSKRSTRRKAPSASNILSRVSGRSSRAR